MWTILFNSFLESPAIDTLSDKHDILLQCAVWEAACNRTLHTVLLLQAARTIASVVLVHQWSSCSDNANQVGSAVLWLSPCFHTQTRFHWALNTAWRPYKVRRLFSRSICTPNERNGSPRGFSQPSPVTAMLFSPFECTNPPPPPFLPRTCCK